MKQNMIIFRKPRITIYLVLISLFFIWIPINIEAQKQWEPGQRKNVIKFNPTPMLLFSDVRNLTFSYERLLTPNQSLSVKLGGLVFPRIADDTILNLIAITSREKRGINISAEYRFYPVSRNRRPAPDGLYIGPYFTYYGFRFKNNFDILYTTADQQGSITGKLNIFNVGFQLGYQFIFWKRVSLDLILFGPSISYYMGDLKFQGNLDEEEINNIDKEIVDKILNRFPYLRTIFSNEGLEFTRQKTTFNLGFRYAVQIGIAF